MCNLSQKSKETGIEIGIERGIQTGRLLFGLLLCCLLTAGCGGSDQVKESHTCTISIECSSIFDNPDALKPEKTEFVPSDGWILEPEEVSFKSGDTAFDVLKNACNQAGIQMSSRYTPLYGSYYIEGINQLYEFDCGANSGWMFSINGTFPNYGCSEYTVEDGDKIEWKYTCDLGSDVGNSYQE